MKSDFQKYLEEALPKVELNDTTSQFEITIEEHHTGVFYIEANDIEEAMQIAEDKYKAGKLIVERDGHPTAKLMMAEDTLTGEATEWEEF